MDVVLIDGPFNDLTARLSRQPSRILVANTYLYARIDDPDTGLSLDAYAYEGVIQ